MYIDPIVCVLECVLAMIGEDRCIVILVGELPLLINDYNIFVVQRIFFFFSLAPLLRSSSNDVQHSIVNSFLIFCFLSFSIGFSSSSLGSPTTPLSTLFAVVVLIHGESYSWGAGHLIDGGMLANKSRMVVVTLNYRLGVLGISFSKRFLSFFLSFFLSK